MTCQVGHSFDVAREGYVHLLPPHHRKRGISGDPADMLRARRRFLDASYFGPLADALVSEVAHAVKPGDHHPSGPNDPCVLEVGCGEGHYIGAIATELGSRADRPDCFVGMDLSKSAVRMAARRHRNVLFFVGDVHRRIYLRTGSVRVILNIFSPRNPGEFARILEPGGRVLVVIPSDKHLASLRNRLDLLSIQEEKEKRVLRAFAGGFRLASRTVIDFPLELTPEAAQDVVAMGPSQWHRPPDQAVSLSVQSLSTEASFVLLHFERH